MNKAGPDEPVMTESKSPSNAMDSEAEITLGLLNAVHENHSLTQRSMAQDLGIALGLANAYLKRCVRKGYVKVRQIPKNRYAYYLTPQGFAEKSRLTAEYFSQSFNFFRLARTECEEIFQSCAERGWHRVMLVGVSDMGEIATLCVRDQSVILMGFADPESDRTSHAGLPVSIDMKALETADAAVVTDLRDPQSAYDAARRVLPPERVLAPPFLKVLARPPEPGDWGAS